eukprot:SAG31_NODE_2037_length_6604_cov_2.820600_3_plen_105_part_00
MVLFVLGLVVLLPYHVMADCYDDKEELTECLNKATCALRTAAFYGCTVVCPPGCQDLTDDVYSSCSSEPDWEVALKRIVSSYVFVLIPFVALRDSLTMERVQGL